MEEPRLGFVGTGNRARVHVEQVYALRDRRYAGTDDAYATEHRYDTHAGAVPDWVESVADLEPRVTALFDPDPDQRARTRSLCAEHGDDPATFDSFEAFLDSGRFDAVVLVSPNDFHAEQAVALLRRDVDVLCEKPLADDLAGHDRIIAAADDSESFFYPAYNLRSAPFFARIKELLEEDAVGELGMVTCQEVRAPFKDSYHYAQERSGGALLDKNCHDFDLFNWYVDADPVRVSAAGGQHVLDRDASALDQASVVVEYENGVVGTLELCMYAPWGQRGRGYELRGSDGLLRSPEAEGAIDRYTRRGRDRLTVDTSGSHGGADAVQMRRFLRGLAGEAEPPGDLEDAKKAAAVALAGERAVETGESVRIDADYDIRE
jgi:predicted dehydrogenase